MHAHESVQVGLAVAVRIEPVLRFMPKCAQSVDLKPELEYKDVLPYTKLAQGKFRVPTTARAVDCMHVCVLVVRKH